MTFYPRLGVYTREQRLALNDLSRLKIWDLVSDFEYTVTQAPARFDDCWYAVAHECDMWETEGERFFTRGEMNDRMYESARRWLENTKKLLEVDIPAVDDKKPTEGGSAQTVTVDKVVRRLGNSWVVNIGTEVKSLGLESGDRIRVTIERIGEKK